MVLIFFICFLVLYQVSTIYCHVPDYASTPSNKVEQYCIMAETCVHDTIPICGSMGDQKRSFLDLCDLLEYVCDTMQNLELDANSARSAQFWRKEFLLTSKTYRGVLQ